MSKSVHLNETFEKLTLAASEWRGHEFENCVFRQCDFSNGKLWHNRFVDCQFILCNLAMAKLNNTVLNNVAFKDCKLLGVVFSECSDSFFSVDFENCLLDYASFANRKMPKARFEHCSLKDANFSNTQLGQAVFSQCNLEGALFNRTQLRQADLSSAYQFAIDPELNDIKRAKFSLQGLAGLLTKHEIQIE